MKSNLLILASVLCLFSANAFARGGQSSNEGSTEGGAGPTCYVGSDFCDSSFAVGSEDESECTETIGMQKGSWKNTNGQCMTIGGDGG
jgi:hypothetical protein